MKPELLSPAGDREALEAALKAGADAVYLGGPRFSARAYATNFTDEELQESIRLCRRQGVKLYITINTLLKDSELLDACAYVVQVWNLGVDAIIIQDPGLIWLIQHVYPAIELHASTQMTVHNLKGADLLARKGLKRMVLARELTLEEIAEISRVHETEVFIHGALCISYSGKCLMSSMLGGRSGNRGRCAQNCRMEYKLLDEGGTKRAEGFLMSPKDLSILDIVPAMAATGTASFKIEGRMKRPEYVFETVRQYRRALLGEAWDGAGIKQLFNREGFNHAFLLGNDGRDMMAYHSSKNTGIVLGRIRQGTLKLQTDLSLGDGVKAGDVGFIVTKLKVRGKEVPWVRAGENCEVFPRQYQEGDLVIKTSDSRLLKGIQEELRQKPRAILPIALRGFFQVGQPFRLTALFRGQEFSAQGAVVEASSGSALTEERIRENLGKTGGTPFVLQELSLEYETGFLPLSALNEVRRAVLAQAEEALYQAVSPVQPLAPESLRQLLKEQSGSAAPAQRLPEYLVTLSSREQLAACLEALAEEPRPDFAPVLFLWHRQKGSLNLADAGGLDEKGIDYWIRMPQILKSEFPAVVASVEKLTHCKGILTDNYGVMEHFRQRGLPLVGDYKLNIMNSAGEFLFPELSGFTLSEELNHSELRAMSGKANKVVILYGRTELMHSEYCPIGSTVGGLAHHQPCTVPCAKGSFSLKDRKGEQFIIQTDLFCRSYIMNSRIKNILDQQETLRRVGFRHFRGDLTTEDKAETRLVLKALFQAKELSLQDSTRGHYRRGVE